MLNKYRVPHYIVTEFPELEAELKKIFSNTQCL